MVGENLEILSSQMANIALKILKEALSKSWQISAMRFSSSGGTWFFSTFSTFLKKVQISAKSAKSANQQFVDTLFHRKVWKEDPPTPSLDPSTYYESYNLDIPTHLLGSPPVNSTGLSTRSDHLLPGPLIGWTNLFYLKKDFQGHVRMFVVLAFLFFKYLGAIQKLYHHRNSNCTTSFPPLSLIVTKLVHLPPSPCHRPNSDKLFFCIDDLDMNFGGLYWSTAKI